jgi:hypothetical protein
MRSSPDAASRYVPGPTLIGSRRRAIQLIRGHDQRPTTVNYGEIERCPLILCCAKMLLGKVMSCLATSIKFLPAAIVAALSATLFPADVLADIYCSGHRLLSNPRPEASCRDIVAQIFVSPDKALRALARRYQPRRHVRYGKPRRGPLKRRRHGDFEGLFLAARDEWVLRLPREMVPRFPILRLQHGVFGRPFALVVPDHGV